MKEEKNVPGPLPVQILPPLHPDETSPLLLLLLLSCVVVVVAVLVIVVVGGVTGVTGCDMARQWRELSIVLQKKKVVTTREMVRAQRSRYINAHFSYSLFPSPLNKIVNILNSK